ncbi:DNA primase [Helicobacter ailurogastricus]|uniref:DNA primase n=1 Tax=Helicobacter ailurogastricus TaxID=1578720 RepID=A0A0K2X604_9HELI|nr:DNA primase [Helicobacter ailurogastricus]CRF41576.1 DNA primase [Helicobacter ailurogastricus]CRF42775.1 DNA primase [Helicobacter ailurogastricus]CRF43882.1 DNA primase [Helicobacter ailurogastricus]
MLVIQNIKELKESVDIVDVMGKLVDLKRFGFSYKCVCPFHTEKTPSLSINPQKKYFYCFGCGVSGDVITFVQRLKGLEFVEAVKLVAQLSNFSLEIVEDGRTEPLRDALEALAYTANVAAIELLNAEDNRALAYVRARGLSTPLIKTFKLGFCSLRVVEKVRQAFNVDVLRLAGILNEKGHFSMLHRLLMPVMNFRGQVVGFSGRYPADNVPPNIIRYINSPATPLFKKSFMLYNLHQAMPSILEKKQVIVCEGFFDVMAFTHFGYPNVVCTMGVAFSEHHLKILTNLGVEIVFSFDSDVAGFNATLKALEMCFKAHYGACAVVYAKTDLPKSKAFKDLDKFLKNGVKPNLFKQDGWTYFCRHHLRPELSIADKDKNYSYLNSLIQSYPPFLKDAFLSKLQALASVKSEVFKTYSKKPSIPHSKFSLEGRILLTMLESEEFRFIAYKNLSTEDFVLKEVFLNILAGNLDSHQAQALRSKFVMLEPKYWQMALRQFKAAGLKRSLQSALDSRDLKMVWLLDQRLSSVKRGF